MLPAWCEGGVSVQGMPEGGSGRTAASAGLLWVVFLPELTEREQKAHVGGFFLYIVPH